MTKLKQGDRVYNQHGNPAIYVRRADGGGHWVQREYEFHNDPPTIWPVVYSEDEHEFICANWALQQAQARYDIALAKMKV